MPVTQKDIANQLKISRSLVSQVLADHPKTRVSPEIRRQILQAAMDQGYQPNMAASVLRSGKTRVAAFVFVKPQGPAYNYSALLEPLGIALGEHGFSVLNRVYTSQEELLVGLEQMVNTRSCDVIVLGGNHMDVRDQGDLLERLRMPFIVVGRFEESRSNWMQVDYDHEKMMGTCVQHLASLGHTRIAFFGYDNLEPYTICLQEGFKASYHSVIGIPHPKDLFGVAEALVESCEQMIESWLALPAQKQPTALVIGAGVVAWRGTERALFKAGRWIGDEPEGFSVAGMSADPVTLSFGTATMFPQIGWIRLGYAMVEHLLLPMLSGKPIAQTIVRFCPVLESTDKFNFRQIGARLPGQVCIRSEDRVK